MTLPKELFEHGDIQIYLDERMRGMVPSRFDVMMKVWRPTAAGVCALALAV